MGELAAGPETLPSPQAQWGLALALHLGLEGLRAAELGAALSQAVIYSKQLLSAPCVPGTGTQQGPRHT